MGNSTNPVGSQTGRLEQLSADFAALAPRLPEGAQREALSILHGMIQELLRSGGMPAAGPVQHGAATIEDLLNLHQHAPAMEGGAINRPLPTGTRAPDFALRNARGEEVTLSTYSGRTLVIAFYPLDWSPGCSRQLDLYQQELPEFAKRGVDVVGISVDSLYSHGAWATARGLTMPLLADFNPKGAVARKYNAWREADGFSERALYIVDGSGVIRYSHVSPRLEHVPDIYELLGALDALDGTRGS